MDFINIFIKEGNEIILKLKEELKGIRTGKANPSLVENIIVGTYNNTVKLKLKELTAITTLDNTTLLIKPFDPTTISDIEKALLKSPLGLSPQLQNQQFLLKFPPLTQEQREKILRFARQLIEEYKNYIRKIRDEFRKQIKLSFENKNITEDERFRIEKQIDEETKKMMSEIEDLKNKKESEILTL